jgi:hypothetical protein
MLVVFSSLLISMWTYVCPLQGPLEGVGPEIFDFFRPKWHSLRSLPSPKSIDFQGPPLPMALVMDSPASKSLPNSQYKQQLHS